MTQAHEKLILDLKSYIRDREKDQVDNNRDYYSFWGKISGNSAALKIRSAKKMIAFLQGKTTVTFSADEIRALSNSTLHSKLANSPILSRLPKQADTSPESLSARYFARAR